MREIVGNDATPEGEIHQRTGLRCPQLQVEAAGIDGGGMSIEGHIEEAGRPSRCQRLRACDKTLPVASPRLIEVYMGVNYPWKKMQAGGIDLFLARACKFWFDGNDAPLRNRQVHLAKMSGNKGAVTYDKVIKTHKLSHLLLIVI